MEANQVSDNQFNPRPGVFQSPATAEPIDADYVDVTGGPPPGMNAVPPVPRYATPQLLSAAPPELGPMTGSIPQVEQPAPGQAPGTVQGFGFWDFLNQPVAFGIPVWAVGLGVAALGVSYYVFFVKDAKPAAKRRG